MPYAFSRSPLAPFSSQPWQGSRFPSRLRALALVVVVAFFAVACAENATGLFGRGRVGVTFSDSPGDDFVSVHMTVSRLELLADGKPVALFEGLETFDLRELRDTSELFSMADRVPAGHYSGVRIFVEEIELVRLDEDGTQQVSAVELPAGRVMELYPRLGIEVGAGETAVIEIDFDMLESLVRADAPGEPHYSLHPAGPVTLLSDLSPGRLARVHGKVVPLDEEASSLRVCRTHFALRPRQDRFESHPELRRCVDVVIDQGSSLFDANGDSALPGDIAQGSEVTVFGRFRLDESQDDQRPLSFHAGLVLVGEAGRVPRSARSAESSGSPPGSAAG